MSDVTIKQLAKVVGTPVDKLLAQLAEAGMPFTDADQVISSTEKVKLLGFLRRTHGKQETPAEVAAPRQVTLRRRTVSELTVATGARGSAAKTVNIEVRQKRTYVKRSLVDDQTPADAEREDALRKLQESQLKRESEDLARAEADRRRQEEDAKLRAAEEARRKAAEEEAQRKQAEQESAPRADADVRRPAAEAERPAAAAAVPPRRADERAPGDAHRHKGKTHGSHRMQEAGSEEEAPRYFGAELHLSREGAARRTGGRKKPKARQADSGSRSGAGHGFSKPIAPVVRDVAVGESITVADLAAKLAVKGAEVVKTLFKMGVMTTINQTIDHDTAVLVAEELGHKVTRAAENDAEVTLLAHHDDQQGERETRPPVVTIMGHVDHGKTSLLDYIRRTKVAAGEAGGITQHIGAYHVETDKGVITFLDTPGHAAFSSMRARGAQLTDIVVLVVAADDGVMPQTIEAIQHARSANVPLIVAMNKMDKPEANPDNVKQGLVQYEVVPEDWGGDVQFVPLSAKTGEGVDALLDAISVQAEVMELRAVHDGRASGVVIESSLDKGRGPVATVLVQQGTLKKGDFLVCGVDYGRVRVLFDEAGRQVDEAGPSIPVQILGLSGVPAAGDDFVVVADERLAKDVAQQREQKRRESRLVKQAGSRMEDIMAQMGQGTEQLSLNLVVKADVQGSAEALREALVGLSNELIRINVIISGVGGITESDANSAVASKATIIGFNVRADASARRIIESNGLDLRYFSIIYDVIDQVKQVASGMLGTEVREEIIGIAQVREVFRSSKFGAIAGCMVVEGTVKRNKPIRVLRDNTVIFQGELESLRRFKENVDEVRNGTECGIGVKQYNDVKPGDQIECFERIEVARTF
ncbi:translation initiation factor IF-2 [Dokdonella koreensis]|uniref:Translation initiation factor IF-2 n=1 Tax=Dokdonella koreensis DS-123 TaxID=1300342 RepID=A0A160DSU0_9GAMM|nr:translation initiation factor IF-2 [Dokdonella koreensis]ANB17387.1 Translation initiation factor IF-2 [Dokdonella koreensis DS-123]